MVFRKKVNPRTARFELRLLPEEAADIEDRASKSGLTTSEYFRRCALGRKIHVRYDADAILALRDIAKTVGELRDQVSKDASSFSAEDFRVIAAECIETMRRVI